VASDAEVRAWARETGRTVSAKGAVSHALRQAYAAAHNGEPPAAPDYPDGMTDDDFDVAEAELPDDLPDDLDMGEVAPRPVTPKASSFTTRTRLKGAFRRGKTSGAAKPKGKARPRVSTADLIGSAWRIGAKLAPALPLQRVLSLQSEIAGPMIDGQVKGTIVDPVLQVLARHYQAGEVAGALLGPNLGIGTAMVHQMQCARAGTEPNPVILQACAEVTRYGLKAMMRLGGDAFAARLAAEKEDEERYGASMDAILEWIMSPPADPVTEQENAARMAGVFAGQPAPEPAAM
jgi:hypothetical protein